jgi:cellulose 1,4-beta-cellobiosidase
VNLSWSACAGAATYNLYRSSGSEGPYVTLATGLTHFSYTDTAVTNGSIYYYYVAAVNASGLPAGSSNQVSATPASVSGLPLPPSNLTATSPAKKRINIAWIAPSDATSATTYKIYRSTVSGGPYKYIDTTSNTSYLNLGMGSGITYYYVVTAVNASGVESPYSNQAYVTAK